MQKGNEQQGPDDEAERLKDQEQKESSEQNEKPLGSTAQTPKKVSDVEKKIKGNEEAAEQESLARLFKKEKYLRTLILNLKSNARTNTRRSSPSERSLGFQILKDVDSLREKYRDIPISVEKLIAKKQDIEGLYRKMENHGNASRNFRKFSTLLPGVSDKSVLYYAELYYSNDHDINLYQGTQLISDITKYAKKLGKSISPKKMVADLVNGNESRLQRVEKDLYQQVRLMESAEYLSRMEVELNQKQKELQIEIKKLNRTNKFLGELTKEQPGLLHRAFTGGEANLSPQIRTQVNISRQQRKNVRKLSGKVQSLQREIGKEKGYQLSKQDRQERSRNPKGADLALVRKSLAITQDVLDLPQNADIKKRIEEAKKRIEESGDSKNLTAIERSLKNGQPQKALKIAIKDLNDKSFAKDAREQLDKSSGFLLNDLASRKDWKKQVEKFHNAKEWETPLIPSIQSVGNIQVPGGSSVTVGMSRAVAKILSGPDSSKITLLRIPTKSLEVKKESRGAHRRKHSVLVVKYQNYVMLEDLAIRGEDGKMYPIGREGKMKKDAKALSLNSQQQKDVERQQVKRSAFTIEKSNMSALAKGPSQNIKWKGEWARVGVVDIRTADGQKYSNRIMGTGTQDKINNSPKGYTAIITNIPKKYVPEHHTQVVDRKRGSARGRYSKEVTVHHYTFTKQPECLLKSSDIAFVKEGEDSTVDDRSIQLMKSAGQDPTTLRTEDFQVTDRAQAEVLKVLPHLESMIALRQGGSDIMAKVGPLQSLLEGGIQGNKTEEFTKNAQRMARELKGSYDSSKLLTQYSDTKLALATLKQLDVGIISDEFEQAIEATEAQLEQISALLKSDAIGEICSRILSDDFNADTFMEWMSTNGVILFVTVVGAVLIMTGVGSPLGAALVSAGVSAGAATVLAGAAASAIGAYIGSEVGKGIVSTYHDGEKFKSDAQLLYEGQLDVGEYFKRMGVQVGQNFVTTGLIMGAGQIIGTWARGLAQQGLTAGTASNAASLAAYKEAMARLISRSAAKLGQVEELIAKIRPSAQGPMAHLARESVQEFWEEGVETGFDALSSSADQVGNKMAARVLKGCALAFSILNGAKGPGLTSNSQARVVMDSSVRTGSNVDIRLTYDQATVDQLRAELEGSEAEGKLTEVGDGVYTLTSEVDGITIVRTYSPSAEPEFVRGLTSQTNTDGPAPMQLFGVEFDAASGEYTYYQAGDMVTLQEYLKVQGIAVGPGPRPGTITAQYGNESVTFRVQEVDPRSVETALELADAGDIKGLEKHLARNDIDPTTRLEIGRRLLNEGDAQLSPREAKAILEAHALPNDSVTDRAAKLSKLIKGFTRTNIAAGMDVEQAIEQAKADALTITDGHVAGGPDAVVEAEPEARSKPAPAPQPELTAEQRQTVADLTQRIENQQQSERQAKLDQDVAKAREQLRGAVEAKLITQDQYESYAEVLAGSEPEADPDNPFAPILDAEGVIAIAMQLENIHGSDLTALAPAETEVKILKSPVYKLSQIPNAEFKITVEDGRIRIDIAGEVSGHVELHRPAPNSTIMIVESSNLIGDGGYGPLLYDLAIEVATANGYSVVTDRNIVSDPAYEMWQGYYASRPDIQKTELRPGEFHDGPRTRELMAKMTDDPSTWPPKSDPVWALWTGYQKKPEVLDAILDSGQLSNPEAFAEYNASRTNKPSSTLTSEQQIALIGDQHIGDIAPDGVRALERYNAAAERLAEMKKNGNGVKAIVDQGDFFNQVGSLTVSSDPSKVIEYSKIAELTARWRREMADSAGIAPENYFVVTGNHDIPATAVVNEDGSILLVEKMRKGAFAPRLDRSGDPLPGLTPAQQATDDPDVQAKLVRGEMPTAQEVDAILQDHPQLVRKFAVLEYSKENTQIWIDAHEKYGLNLVTTHPDQEAIVQLPGEDFDTVLKHMPVNDGSSFRKIVDEGDVRKLNRVNRSGTVGRQVGSDIHVPGDIRGLNWESNIPFQTLMTPTLGGWSQDSDGNTQNGFFLIGLNNGLDQSVQYLKFKEGTSEIDDSQSVPVTKGAPRPAIEHASERSLDPELFDSLFQTAKAGDIDGVRAVLANNFIDSAQRMELSAALLSSETDPYVLQIILKAHRSFPTVIRQKIDGKGNADPMLVAKQKYLLRELKALYDADPDFDGDPSVRAREVAQIALDSGLAGNAAPAMIAAIPAKVEADTAGAEVQTDAKPKPILAALEAEVLPDLDLRSLLSPDKKNPDKLVPNRAKIRQRIISLAIEGDTETIVRTLNALRLAPEARVDISKDFLISFKNYWEYMDKNDLGASYDGQEFNDMQESSAVDIAGAILGKNVQKKNRVAIQKLLKIHGDIEIGKYANTDMERALYSELIPVESVKVEADLVVDENKTEKMTPIQRLIAKKEAELKIEEEKAAKENAELPPAINVDIQTRVGAIQSQLLDLGVISEGETVSIGKVIGEGGMGRVTEIQINDADGNYSRSLAFKENTYKGDKPPSADFVKRRREGLRREAIALKRINIRTQRRAVNLARSSIKNAELASYDNDYVMDRSDIPVAAQLVAAAIIEVSPVKADVVMEAFVKRANAALDADPNANMDTILQQVIQQYVRAGPQVYMAKDGSDIASGFIIMDYLEGGQDGDKLTSQIQDPRLPDATRLAYVYQMILAAENATKAKFVLADLKPANSIVMPDGTVRIIDPGLANRRGRKVTNPGATPAFSAPEQAANIGLPSEKSDVYTMGAILYQMVSSSRKIPLLERSKLNGVPIHNGIQTLLAAVRIRNIDKPFDEIIDLNIPADSKPELNALLKEMLSSKPEDRPTMEEARQRLYTILGGRLQEGQYYLGEIARGEVSPAVYNSTVQADETAKVEKNEDGEGSDGSKSEDDSIGDLHTESIEIYPGT